MHIYINKGIGIMAAELSTNFSRAVEVKLSQTSVKLNISAASKKLADDMYAAIPSNRRVAALSAAQMRISAGSFSNFC